MSMNKEYYFDKETGEAKVSVYYKGKKSIGRAKVHPDDGVFTNEFTGYAIADYRAQKRAHEKVCVDLMAKVRKLDAQKDELLRQYHQHLSSAQALDLAEGQFIAGKELFYQKMRELQDPIKQKERAAKIEALNQMMGTMLNEETE